MGMINEDWERVHLTDQTYLKEVEYLEEEYFKYGGKMVEERSSAKISIGNLPFELPSLNNKKNIKRRTRNERTVRIAKRKATRDRRNEENSY